jgi:hypothetical protein
VNRAWVAELVDARDLKSLGAWLCAGSIPAPGTKLEKRKLGRSLQTGPFFDKVFGDLRESSQFFPYTQRKIFTLVV